MVGARITRRMVGLCSRPEIVNGSPTRVGRGSRRRLEGWMCTSGMPIRFTLKAYGGQGDPSIRNFSGGRGCAQLSQKPALTSLKTENPRRIRVDSAGVLKYETHQHLRQRTRYTVGQFRLRFSLRGAPQRERRTPAPPSRWTRAAEQSRQSRGPPNRKQSAMLPG